MRIVTYGAACSLDGFIAAADGSLDWLHFSKDVQDVMATYWASVDTMLMGRKTWEVAQSMGGGGGAVGSGITTYVFSRTLQPADCPGTTLGRDAVAGVTALRGETGRDIALFGGGDLFRSLLAARLVDEISVSVVPVLLGGGVPFLPAPATRAALRLTGHRLYAKTGTMRLDYQLGA